MSDYLVLEMTITGRPQYVIYHDELPARYKGGDKTRMLFHMELDERLRGTPIADIIAAMGKP